VRGKVHGRPNLVRDQHGRKRFGRYGWKGDVATLEQFVAEAFRNELGITSALAPVDLVPRGLDCGQRLEAAWEDDGTIIRAVTAYIASLQPPSPREVGLSPDGRRIFSSIGCADCHTPALTSSDGSKVPLYSDLLLHDLGPALDDRVIQGSARGKDWRTTPLWGLGLRPRLLHDGRATGVKEAVLAHDGEAAEAVRAFRVLTEPERATLLTFLNSL
jgi:CxxC motif-containing protein (DUF1111 family)